MVNIAVIGCGAIGLTTALEIQQRLENRGTVTIFADKFTPNTTSDVAAGLWEPYLLGDNSMEDIIKWSGNTYYYILRLWKEGKAKEAGICLQPVINLFDDKNYTLPVWVSITLGYNELSDSYLKSLCKQYNKTFTGGFMFTTFTWEPAIFLPYLQKTFLRKNGKIIERHIESFNELEEFDVIVNCTGIEARILSKDESVVPFRGQIIRAEAPWQKCIILINVNEDDSCYIIPNMHSVVLGGTKQQSFDTTICSEDSKRFTKNIFKIVPSFAESKIIKTVVGLRPGRFRVRLEEEFAKASSGKTLKIVHNYGHGGAGITLCVGCAQDTADLVENLIKVNKNKL